VTVPKGGVARGQQFIAQYPKPSSNDYPTAKGEMIPMEVITEMTHADGTRTNNMGRWTTELCGCFDVCCSAVWWVRTFKKLNGSSCKGLLTEVTVSHTCLLYLCTKTHFIFVYFLSIFSVFCV